VTLGRSIVFLVQRGGGFDRLVGGEDIGAAIEAGALGRAPGDL